MKSVSLVLIAFLFISFCRHQPKIEYDVIIKNGTLCDGSGNACVKRDLAIRGDTIAYIGDLQQATAQKIIDATGLIVAPGFINMLSWADGALLKDGRSMSDLKQGVTLEVFGEGYSPGPRHKRNAKDTLWTTLGGYFKQLLRKGVSTNVASFVGATSVRMYVLDRDNRKPTASELEQMKGLVKVAMEEGAMGLGSSLIYAPADFASTEELIELSKVAAQYGGLYITHMRSESDRILEAMNETFRIAREANIRTEIYHLKINQQRNWNKVDLVLNKIDSARAAGLTISANMYPYNASGTGLTARLPTWVQEGGGVAMRKRLKNPTVRKRVLDEMARGIPQKNSDPGDVMILGFQRDSLSALYKGKRLTEVARLHGKSADETTLDLIIADRSTIPCIYFLISESNLKQMLVKPYVSICSDAGSLAAEEPYNKDLIHPRAYGSFARFLSKYVRDEKMMKLEEGIRRMTSLPASNLKIKRRGKLATGYFADVVVFDFDKLQDNATFDQPHQYASGMMQVLVNGKLVIENGAHTGAKPGTAVFGPGKKIDRN